MATPDRRYRACREIHIKFGALNHKPWWMCEVWGWKDTMYIHWYPCIVFVDEFVLYSKFNVFDKPIETPETSSSVEGAVDPRNPPDPRARENTATTVGLGIIFIIIHEAKKKLAYGWDLSPRKKDAKIRLNHIKFIKSWYLVAHPT